MRDRETYRLTGGDIRLYAASLDPYTNRKIGEGGGERERGGEGR